MNASAAAPGRPQHGNNFDAVRQAAALLVMFTHQYSLMGLPEPAPLPFMTWGGFGVVVFFSISGYLVAQSWESDPHVLRFLARRALRIWPALTLVTLLAIFGFGAFTTSLPPGDYFGSPLTRDYLGVLKLNVHKSLPGVFEGNARQSVNGSLWTIPFEVRWYVLLGLLGLAGVLRRQLLLLAVALAVAWFAFVHLQAGRSDTHAWTYELGAFFLAGAALHQGRHWWWPLRWWLAAALPAAARAGCAAGWIYIAVWLCLPLAVVWFGTSSTPGLRACGRFGDPSYGLYLFAYPVQQLVLWCSGNALPFWHALGLSLILTLLLAFFSWHAVEKPALDLKRRLRPSNSRMSTASPFHAQSPSP